MEAMRDALAVNAEDWDSFSENCLVATGAFLRARGFPEDFRPVYGRGERSWSSTLSRNQHTYELFIYENAAGFWRDRERWVMFEPAAFRNARDQIDAFLSALGSALDA
jgi:hypothetical protein